MEVKKIDIRGSIVIPYEIREQLKLYYKTPVSVKVIDGKIIIEKLKINEEE